MSHETVVKLFFTDGDIRFQLWLLLAAATTPTRSSNHNPNSNPNPHQGRAWLVSQLVVVLGKALFICCSGNPEDFFLNGQTHARSVHRSLATKALQSQYLVACGNFQDFFEDVCVFVSEERRV